MTGRVWAAAGAVTLGALLVGAAAGAGAAHADVSVSFTAAAAAPVAQVTEDEPTASFHPEGEGDYGYTLVTADPSAATALASVLWPGSAAGNAGTLVAVLGGPDVTALNDPVQASATSGTDQTQSSVAAPTGSAMTASVVPTGPGDEHSTATSTLAGGGFGAAGRIGSSNSASTIDFGSATGMLSVTAASAASDIEIGGVVDIGSVSSSASARSVEGGRPVLTGATAFHRMTIAGQAAYVDGSGVHVGSPGAPAGPAVVDSVDSALAAAGMEVYFTAPHTITVGGTAYYFAATVLFYWAPPGDSSHNSFTMALGGAAVSLTDSPQQDGFGGSSNLGTGGTSQSTGATAPGSVLSTGGGTAAAPSGPAAGASSSPAPQLAGPVGSTAGAALSLPAPPSASVSTGPSRPASAAYVAASQLPGGPGAGWWFLAVGTAIAGGGLTTRVPVLLQRRAASACPRARPSPPTSGIQKGRR